MEKYFTDIGRYTSVRDEYYSVMELSHVQLTDAGVYECSEDGYFESSYGKVTLHVSIANVYLEEVIIADTTDGVLNCTTEDTNCTISWIFASSALSNWYLIGSNNSPDELASEYVRILDDGSLQLLAGSDIGRYSCAVHDGQYVYDRRTYDVITNIPSMLPTHGTTTTSPVTIGDDTIRSASSSIRRKRYYVIIAIVSMLVVTCY